MASKSKSTLTETTITSTKPSLIPTTTPKASRISRGVVKSDAVDLPSPVQKRLSSERSPKVVNSKPVTDTSRPVSSKPVVERRSPKNTTPSPPEKLQTRVSKGPDLQSQLNLLQEDLKKTKEQLVLIETEKATALEELKTAQKLADDASEKLKEAVTAQKQAEDDSEIEKFRALEMEQAVLEVAQKKEDEWKREIESVRTQHALDAASLLSATEDLHRLKQELAVTCDAKNQALSHAEDATKIAETHAEKTEILSSEVTRLKGLLESKLETNATESNMVSMLNAEIGSLKEEVATAKLADDKLVERYFYIQQLNAEISSLQEEVTKAQLPDGTLAEKEAFIEQMSTEIACLKQEQVEAKLLDDKLTEREATIEQMNSEIASLKELVKAKLLDNKLVEREADIDGLNLEKISLEKELAKAKLDENKLIETEASVEQLRVEIDSLKQELAKAKLYESKLIEREASIDQLNVEIVSLSQNLEKSKVYEEKFIKSEASIAKLNEEIASLLQDLARAKAYEDKLIESEASIDQLNVDVISLKQELTKAKTYEGKLAERERYIGQLDVEMASLEEELAEAKTYETKLAEKEASMEQMAVDLEASRMAESYAQNLVNEWRKRVEDLENKSEVSIQLERSATESMVSLEKEIEEKQRLLQNANSEISELKEKVGLLEFSIKRERSDLEDSSSRLGKAKQKASFMDKLVDTLKSELETVKEEKLQALNNEKLAASSVQNLLEEKIKLMDKLENSKEEELKSKTAMESLATALHEVSFQAREAKEKLQSIQTEHESYEMEIDGLKNVLKATNQKYETMLDEANHDRELLMKEHEDSKISFQNMKAEWGLKELQLLDSIKQTDGENSTKAKEINGMVILLKQTEEEAFAIKEEGSMLKDTLKEVEAEVRYLKEVLGEAKAESMKLKESLLDKENELQSVLEENDDLHSREVDSKKKVAELSKLLEEATEKEHKDENENENGDLTDSEKDYDLLPKVIEFSEQNGYGGEVKSKTEKHDNDPTKRYHVNDTESSSVIDKTEHVNGKPTEEPVEGEFKMWESCKIDTRDYSPARETEVSYEEEVDIKLGSGDSFDQLNGLPDNIENTGGSSPPSKQLKKKKPLLSKFGSLLKKKSSSAEKL